MKANDALIKKALQARMERIDDDSFTKDIVQNHLAKKKIMKNMPFINFMSLIAGLCSLIISTGIVLLIRQYGDLIKGLDLTENHGLLMMAVSFLFLINKWIEEVLSNKSN